LVQLFIIKKSGLVLITFQHEGEDNAQKVIAKFNKRNLKKGDLAEQYFKDD